MRRLLLGISVYLGGLSPCWSINFPDLAKVNHHVMRTLTPKTNKYGYRIMSFAAIDFKILIMIDNYASHDKRTFWS